MPAPQASLHAGGLLPGPDDLLREAVTRHRINPGYRGASCWTGIREYVLAVRPDPGRQTAIGEVGNGPANPPGWHRAVAAAAAARPSRAASSTVGGEARPARSRSPNRAGPQLISMSRPAGSVLSFRPRITPQLHRMTDQIPRRIGNLTGHVAHLPQLQVAIIPALRTPCRAPRRDAPGPRSAVHRGRLVLKQPGKGRIGHVTPGNLSSRDVRPWRCSSRRPCHGYPGTWARA